MFLVRDDQINKWNLNLNYYGSPCECHVRIWQVSPQLTYHDTCQIWTWFSGFNIYFCEISYFLKGDINERSFSNPHLWYISGSGTFAVINVGSVCVINRHLKMKWISVYLWNICFWILMSVTDGTLYTCTRTRFSQVHPLVYYKVM